MISLITVTFNSAQTIRETLESVNCQTLKPSEVIIIDGGSIDETIQIIESFTELNIKIISENDHGIYDAMNKGLMLSKYNIIGFLNSDDIFAYDDILESVAHRFSTQKADIVYGNIVYVDKKNLSTVKRSWITGEYDQKKLSRGWCMPHPAFYINRKVLNHVGNFNLEYDLAADYDFILRALMMEKFNICYLDKIFVKMRVGGATNKNIKNIFKQNLQIANSLKKNHRKISFLYFFLAKLYLKIVERYKR